MSSTNYSVFGSYCSNTGAGFYVNAFKATDYTTSKIKVYQDIDSYILVKGY